jgi:hypothetical protein
MRRERQREKASSVQIGFVLNTGIMTVFIAIMLVVIGGGFGDDASSEEELEMVADEIEANIIEADTLIQTGGDLEGAYFSPPDSGVDYTGRIYQSGSGDIKMNLTAPDGAKIGDGGPGEREINFDNLTADDTSVCISGGSSSVRFTERTENIFITSGSCDMEIGVQRTVTQTQ